MNILYINHYAGSIYHGMEYRPYYLAREWVKQGHQVTIVASNFSHIRQKNITLAPSEEYAHEMIDGIRYIWCKTPPYPANGIKRVWNIFCFLRKLKQLEPFLLKEIKPDLVIASSTYPFDTKAAARIARAAKAKFVYEVHDLWPLTPIEVGGMSPWHPFIFAMQRAENFGYRQADKVVSLLPKAKAYMQEHGMTADKFVYIPNGVAAADWVNQRQELPVLHQEKLAELRREHRFIIGYAGGMGEANALTFLLAAARELMASKIALVLVGAGPNKADLEKVVNEQQLTNVHFLPSIGKLQVPSFLAACDALYIGWNKLPIYRFGICPNKLFDYMLAQKPVIHSVTAGNDLVNEANCGISVPAEDVSAIASAMRTLSQLKEEQLHALGHNGYNFVLRNHDYRILATRFLDSLA